MLRGMLHVHVSLIIKETDHDFHLLPTLCMESILNPSFLSLKAAKNHKVIPSKYTIYSNIHKKYNTCIK